MGNKKGQLSVDFFVALIFFLGFVTYIIFQLFKVGPVNDANIKEEAIRIEAYQLSELLVNNPGYPLDWEIKPLLSDIKRIGLSDSTANQANYLASQKISKLNSICNTPTGYNDVRNILDVKDEISISFIDHSGPSDTIWICKSTVLTNKKVSFNVSRTVSVGGTSFAELIVEVWKI